MTAFNLGTATHAYRDSGVFDGRYLWMPNTSSTPTKNIVKIDTTNNNIEYLSYDTGAISFGSSDTMLVNDDIWCFPACCQIDTLTDSVMVIPELKGEFNAAYGIYDDKHIWVRNSSKIYQIDPKTKNYEEFAINFIQSPTVYDGENLWLIPSTVEFELIKFNTDTKEQKSFSWGNLSTTLETAIFRGAVYDGTNLWFIPGRGNHLLKFDVVKEKFQTFTIQNGVNGNTNIENWDAVESDMSSGTFDGKYIWMAPSDYDRLLRIDPQTGSIKGYPINLTTNYRSRFSDITFDGKNLWLIPHHSYNLIKVESSNDNTKLITKKFVDENGEQISQDEIIWQTPGESFVSEGFRELDGYNYLGYELDGDSLVNDDLITLEDVQNNHTIVYVYKDELNIDEEIDIYLLLELEESKNLLATLLPSGTRPEDVIWNSSDSDIALVDENGVVTGISPGESKITVVTSDGKFSAAIMVEVLPIEDTELRLSIHLKEGENCKLMAKFKSTKEDAQPVWNSEDDTVASVEQNGIVTANSVGEVYITATVDDIEEKVHVIVTE